ncbi:hypothetical protein CLF_100089 [Clonorchis sinensis]|uniref:Uncharacterized protein n=1 Tax=Clonorchis sinensis TaxID=79923 RepID=G7Y2L6_CLOSI|nr:hypothetical protein CLF_100089 [Clonorchis sinensis]
MEVVHRQPIRCLFGKMKLDCVTPSRYLQQVDSLCRASTERFRQRYKFDLSTMKPVMSKQCAESSSNCPGGTMLLDLPAKQSEWTWEELDPCICYIPSFYKQDHFASERLPTPSPIQPQTDILAEKSKKILSTPPTNALLLRTPTLFSIWQPRIRRTSLPDPEQSDWKSVTQKTRGRTQSQHTTRSSSNPRTTHRTTSNNTVIARTAPVMREQGTNSKKTSVEVRAPNKVSLLSSQIHQRRQTKSSSDSLAYRCYTCSVVGRGDLRSSVDFLSCSRECVCACFYWFNSTSRAPRKISLCGKRSGHCIGVIRPGDMYFPFTKKMVCSGDIYFFKVVMGAHCFEITVLFYRCRKLRDAMTHQSSWLTWGPFTKELCV